jgi:outer membrane lipoprotein carrier protein
MRWEYRQPPGKLFLTDGKAAWFYSPHSNRVEKSRMKASDDLRAPLAFLIGRLDFRRDFKEFRTYPEGPDTYIVAAPRSDRAPYSQVAFRVNRQRQITLLRVTGQDASILVYRLSDEVVNPALDPRLFAFEPPAQAEIVEEDTP